MPESSLVLSLADRLSPALKTLSGNVKAFDKNWEDMQRGLKQYESAQDQFVKKSAQLRQALETANAEVINARKAYRELGDEVSKNALDKAIEDQARLKQQLNETEGAIRANSAAYKQMLNTAKTSGSGSGGETQSVLGTLIKSGVVKQLGDAFSQAASTGVESLLGQPTADFVNSVASGAVSGAALGALAGPAGAGLGALAGGFSGFLSGKAQVYQAQDDSFKSYVQDSVEGQLEEMTSIRESGSSIAGQREQDQIAFAQRFGSDEAARDYLSQVKAMAVNTNYAYDEITGYSKSLLNTYSPEETLAVLQNLSDATAGLNLDSGGVSMFISGLSRMRTTNKATQEYLNYFSERGLDVNQALSDATGADKSKISEMVTHGDITGTQAADAILAYIQEQYGGLSEKLAGTYDAMVDNLQDAEDNLNAMMGEGYNEARKAGLEAQNDWLSSGQLEEAYKSIGAWQASLENAKEQYIRDAVDEAMGSEEYQSAQAEGDAAEMGRIIMQAKIRGMNEYNANEGKDEVLAQEKSLIQGVREDAALKSDYWDAGVELGKEFSKGLIAGMQTEDVAGTIKRGSWWSGREEWDPNYKPEGYATGLERVPYDNFPALLHEGERVLTASQARGYDAGDGVGTVTITGNEFVIRSESDVDAVARELLEKIRLARLAGG